MAWSRRYTIGEKLPTLGMYVRVVGWEDVTGKFAQGQGIVISVNERMRAFSLHKEAGLSGICYVDYWQHRIDNTNHLDKRSVQNANPKSL